MSFFSKNLFNCAVYLCRQAFFNGQPIPTFNQIYLELKKSDDYQALPSKVAQLVFKQNENWKQNINLGSKTNQNFINIPHGRFIQQLEYLEIFDYISSNYIG